MHPIKAGIGLRHCHVDAFLETKPDIGLIEIHSENFLCAGGPRLAALEAIRPDYALSCHGVGLSLGSAEGLDRDHLANLSALYDRLTPELISEHIAWSVVNGHYLRDLLPLPYTEEALDVVCRNVDHAQNALGRRMLVENPSTYMSFAESTLPEWEFVSTVAARTGCGILLDLNNIHVSATNHGFDALRYIDAVPAGAVTEYHLAGHSARRIEGAEVLIDDHGSAVPDPVWRLYDAALRLIGPRTTTIEWDVRNPALGVLLDQAAEADRRAAAAAALGRNGADAA